MCYYWTCTRHMMPWTGPVAWTSWRDMAWGPGPSASSAGIVVIFRWWRGRESPTENPSVEIEASLRASRCCPPSSMWWWTWWSSTGNPWLQNRRGGGGGDDDGDAAQTARRKIQEQNDGRRRAEEVHTRLTVKAAFFNGDDNLMASTDSVWLQFAFDRLTGIFDQVGMRPNVRKAVGGGCRPYRAAGVREDDAFTWRMTGE